jgi:hypothetical protein
VNPAIAAITLFLLVATSVLDHAGLIPHRPKVEVGLAVAALAAGWAVSRVTTSGRRRRRNDPPDRQGPRA